MVRTILGIPYYYKEVGRIRRMGIGNCTPLQLEIIKGVSEELQKWIESAVKETDELMNKNRSKETHKKLAKQTLNSNKADKLFQKIRKDKDKI